MNNEKIDTCNIMTKTIKYSILGLSVGVIVYTVPKTKLDINTILMISTLSSFVYVVLDGPLFNKDLYSN